MGAFLIDGKAVAATIHARLKEESELILAKLGRRPGLAVVLVGENPASRVYVAAKAKTAKLCGIDAFDTALPEKTSNHELLATLAQISADSRIDGILLQLPLPEGLDEAAALCAIAPELDVDGLTPTNQGLLMRGAKTHRPCTPKGIVTLIDHARAALGKPQSLAGEHVVVVGRSVLVGKPVSLMLLERHCTVTMCHSRTKDLPGVCREADILVAAIGKPEFFDASFVKPGAVVIDVGINRLPDGRLVGDVNFTQAQEVAAAITPVPGGVGPLTIASLLENTVNSARTKCN